jgi:hypothetical protein
MRDKHSSINSPNSNNKNQKKKKSPRSEKEEPNILDSYFIDKRIAET